MTAQPKLQWLGDNEDGWYLRRHNGDGSTELLAIVSRNRSGNGFLGLVGTQNRDEDRFVGRSAKALRVQIYNRLTA